MNKINLWKDGHPLRLNELRLVQDSYLNGFKSVVYSLFPNGSGILDGLIVTLSGNNVIKITSGSLAIKGEICDFNGFESGTADFPNAIALNDLYFQIVDEAFEDLGEDTYAPSEVRYETGELKEVHRKRYAKVFQRTQEAGTDGEFYKFFSLKGGLVLEGSIIPWVKPANKNIDNFFTNSGLGINSALGYAICNGNNNTPDLRGFYLGMATNGYGLLNGGDLINQEKQHSSLITPETRDGSCSVKLNGDQNGKHSHGVQQQPHSHGLKYRWENERGANKSSNLGTTAFISPNMKGNNSYNQTAKTEDASISITIKDSGEGNAHENRPLTYYLYYIMKIG